MWIFRAGAGLIIFPNRLAVMHWKFYRSWNSFEFHILIRMQKWHILCLCMHVYVYILHDRIGHYFLHHTHKTFTQSSWFWCGSTTCATIKWICRHANMYSTMFISHDNSSLFSYISVNPTHSLSHIHSLAHSPALALSLSLSLSLTLSCIFSPMLSTVY